MMVKSLLTTALAVTFWEFVKQMGVRFTQQHAPKAVADGLIALDRLLPELIREGVTSAELEDRLRQELGHLTGTDWKRIRREFDPAVFVDRLA